MTESEAPRIASEDEFPAVMELLNRYFHFERGGMEARFPYAYDRSRIEHHAVIERDGRIVSHAAAVPQTIVVDGAEIECWGIGGVATHKQYRGNGYMSRLLEFWLERLDAAGVPLVELGGDRQRYATFGWENAGRDRRYRITERSISDGPIASAADVETYDGEDGQLDLLQSLYGVAPRRAKRTREESASIFGQRGLETLLYRTADESAYISFTRESRDRSVDEYGGSEIGVRSLLGYLFRTYDVKALTVYASPADRLNPVFERLSGGWSVHPHRKLNLRDLYGLFDAFRDVLVEEWERRDGTASGEVTLGMADCDGVRLSYGADGLDVDLYNGRPAVELDRLEMTRLLFGAPDETRAVGRRHPVLRSLLPLGFHIPHSQHV